MRGPEERESAASESKEKDPIGQLRLLAGYTAVGLLALIVAGAILALSSGSTTTDRGNPHINVASGSTNGAPPDNRDGIKTSVVTDLDLRDAARTAGCVLWLHLPEEGHQHIPPTAPEPDYRTTPPTSGKHIDEQQADGAYRETPRPVALVHSLEHGRLTIQYQPDLPEQAQRELIGLFDTMYGGTALFPNSAMPYAVAATTWTNLLGCHSYHGITTLAAIQVFGRATWGRFGGEPVTGLQPDSPTPHSP